MHPSRKNKQKLLVESLYPAHRVLELEGRQLGMMVQLLMTYN
jgi:hypothetical protein